LRFDNVYIADPHSNVAAALFENLTIVDISKYLRNLDARYNEKGGYIYFPDEGAMKRYKDYFPLSKKIYGVKERDWKTGEILGLKVHDENCDKLSEDDVRGKTVLMVDDIISYGGTMYYSALKLKELGFWKICAYATHTENSVLDKEKGTFIKCLEDGTVDKLMTTDSIYTGKHPNIEIVKVWY
jgi:ribose-phosphate pyrophosphokinase